ncbi:MAG: hypothetical protein KDE14_04810 [Rhodobacteraceae bacterium]|nr:hypothetical protein [Paracoccaceae bacterium]
MTRWRTVATTLVITSDDGRQVLDIVEIATRSRPSLRAIKKDLRRRHPRPARILRVTSAEQIREHA